MADYNWEHYLAFADGLITDNIIGDFDEQTKIRIAISRAYYAAYHIAEDFLERNNYITYRTGTHETVIKRFEELANQYKQQSKIYNSINQSLNRLKKERVTADYYASKTITKAKSEFNCLEAHEIIDKIKNL